MKKHCQNIKMHNSRHEQVSLVEDPEDLERLREMEQKFGIRSSDPEPRGPSKSRAPSSDTARPMTAQEAIDFALAKSLQEHSSQERRRSTRSTGGRMPFLSLTQTKRTTRSDKPSNEGMKEAVKRPLEIDEDLVWANKRTKSLQLPEPRWSRPLIYPSSGLGRTPVEYDDLYRLNPEEWLNDNIINFYMK